jgi:predicted RNA methylase
MTELASVSAGLRSSALVFLTAEELVRAHADCAANGLELTPLAAPSDTTIRAAVHRPGLGPAWRSAWAAGNDEAIGQMLGFPACCRQFFQREWVEARRPDVTPAMRTVEGPWPANIMLRWLGVRLVPHLPCSGDCAETARQAELYRAAGEASGADVHAIERLLTLPVKYDALAGVAIIETPHFRFMAGAGKEEVRLARAASPCSSSTCQGAPCPAPAHPEHHHDAPRAERSAVMLPDYGDAVAADNGFTSARAMHEAHGVVARAASVFRSVVDLGCGDGALLARLAATGGGPGPWVGVESDEGRAKRGRVRRGASVDVRWARIEDIGAWRDYFDLALLMPGRLLEMEGGDRYYVTAALRQRASRVVLYAYGDVLLKYGGLRELAQHAGAYVVGTVYEGPGVQAAEGKFL